MQPAALRALEFDRIRDALASEALTLLGRARAARLEPSTEPAEIDRRLQLTAEASALLLDGGSLAISAPDDFAAITAALDISDEPLEPLQLLGLARFLESVDTVASSLRHRTRLLAEVAGRAASFAAEVRAIRRAIEPSGEVNDDASPALKELRGKLRRQRAKLRSTLESLTRERDTAKYLQDQIITDRNGRYVLVLRAEHREAIPGIVHGSSASGASLFLEPLPTVDLNNEIVSLVEREREEVWRILLALTNAIRLRDEDFAATLEAGADLDELYAKAQLGRRLGGVAPVRAADGRVEFRGARHPLLVLREGAFSAPVAVDLVVIPPTRALVISGPNTGGKTVALKAFGLLSLMAQSGLLIPVEGGSQFTAFRSIFADIGDEQSIAASLSTFSAHIANIVGMDRAFEAPALVLLDEVGGGTDPTEGGALGTAVIDHFRARGAVVVATTHDDTLKSYAATTQGVVTAAFGFDPDTYAPTYRLIYGAPGRSLALEIAERLGMPPAVVATARERRSARESQLADHLARMDKELAGMERERRSVEADRERIAGEREALVARESRLAEREAVLKRRMDDKLNERLREARQEVDRIVADLKGKAGSLVRQHERPQKGSVTTGDIGSLRSEARAALDSVGDRLVVSEEEAQPDRMLESAPNVGDTVYVATFGSNGLVRSVSGKRIEVDVRGKRMRVGLKDLRKREAGRGEPGARSGEQGVGRRGARSLPPGSQLPAPRDLVLIGSTVDDAIDRTEKFLDDALRADEHRLRVVHGHGTGRLREALRAHFRRHPLIASVAPASEDEGGEAATIVELKD
jgi:DNA mismatch repair protein MutS2